MKFSPHKVKKIVSSARKKLWPGSEIVDYWVVQPGEEDPNPVNPYAPATEVGDVVIQYRGSDPGSVSHERVEGSVSR